MKENNFFKRLISSPFLSKLSLGKRAAFIAMFAAISVISNLILEIRIFDIQFSLTIMISGLIGIMLGPVWGLTSCIIGDLAGYFLNSWGQLYMPWVGLSTGMFAFIAGLIFMNRSKSLTALLIRTAIFTATTFLICTAGINSLGFYLYNKNTGFSTAVIDYVSQKFGGERVTFLFYLVYRLIFKGQIFNSLFNYAMLFLLLPVLRRVKLFESYI